MTDQNQIEQSHSSKGCLLKLGRVKEWKRFTFHIFVADIFTEYMPLTGCLYLLPILVVLVLFHYCRHKSCRFIFMVSSLALLCIVHACMCGILHITVVLTPYDVSFDRHVVGGSTGR